MDRSVKIALAALVFLVGTSFAFLYRRPLPDQLGDKSAEASRLVLHGPRWSDPHPTLKFRSTDSSTKAELPSVKRSPSTKERVGFDTAKPSEPSVRLKSTVLSPIDTGRPPPSLARVFPRHENSEDSRWGTAIGHRLPGSDQRFVPRSLTHVIVDGDTLDVLAGRYLDDSSRSGEIFEANRHLLTDPNALPIGAELTIPLGPSSSPVSPNGGVLSGGLVPDKPLVPVVVPD